jgi:hypothetical protein
MIIRVFAFDIIWLKENKIANYPTRKAVCSLYLEHLYFLNITVFHGTCVTLALVLT